MKSKKLTNPRAVIYVRISRARDNQTSLRTQEQAAREYAKHRGWEVIEPIMIDEGISAWSGKNRPGLNRAMEMIESKRANILLVWKLDRFARSIIHFHELFGRIQRADGEFVSVTDNIDSSTTQGQIMLALVSGFAQMESDIKSERISIWQEDRIENGEPNGGQRTYGYHKQSKSTLTINEPEAAILRDAAIRILSGDSLQKVLRDLQPQSVTGNGPMTARGLRSALMNPTVGGYRRGSGNVITKGNWNPVLDHETWIALGQLFANPERRTGLSNQVGHLLSGIMTCGKCGKSIGIRKWKANPTKRQPYTQESHRLTCQCGNSIDEQNAERVVSHRLWEILTPNVWDEWRTSGKGYDPVVIDELMRARETIITNQVLGKVRHEWAEEQLAEIDRRQAIAESDDPLDLPKVEDIRMAWMGLSILDKRKVLRQAFEAIVLNPANGTRDPYKRIAFA